MNATTISALFGLVFVEYFLVMIALCCSCGNWQWMTNGIFMNSTIELILLSYSQLVFACLLNFTDFQSGTSFLTLSDVLLIVFFMLLILLPLLIRCFFTFNYEDLSHRSVRQKYDACYVHLNIWEPINLHEPFFQLLRKFLIGIICVFMTGYPLFQIASLFLSQLIHVIYILGVKP
jgi:hypothetical protein